MELILDAYNILHCSHVLPQRYAQISATDMGEMINRSALPYTTVTIVCDGRPKPDEIITPQLGSIRLLYSGPTEVADTLIENLLDDSTAPKHITVVSNDNRIRRAAKRHRATILKSETFLRQLTASLRKQGETEPEKPLDDPDVAMWLKKFDIPQSPAKLPPHLQPTPPPTPPTPTAKPSPKKPPRDADLENKMKVDLPPDALLTDTARWLKEFGYSQPDDTDTPNDSPPKNTSP